VDSSEALATSNEVFFFAQRFCLRLNTILSAQKRYFAGNPLGVCMENWILTLSSVDLGLTASVGFAESAVGMGTSGANLGSSALSLGLFHGFIFSFPLSAPILICIYRFLCEGIRKGSLAVAGTILGQICFVSFLLGGGATRPFVQFWYTTEPFLALIGFAISLKLATDFFSGRASGRSMGNFGGLGNTWNMRESVSIAGISFLLMFLNPAMPATSSRILLSSPLFPSLGANAQVYNFGFLITAALSLGILWPLIFSATIQLVNRGKILFDTGILAARGNPLFAFSKDGNSESATSSSRGSYENVVQPRFLAFLIVGCLISGGLQYSWRLFTQYPLEAVLGNGSQFGTGYSLVGLPNAREFPSFDSNIRHRDKNLPVDRHVPIEKMNARRTLSGRPPLSEEQKSDAYFKFNSFFINNLEQNFENTLISSRLGQFQSQISPRQQRNYDEIDYLQKLKTQFEGEGFKDQSLSLNLSLENNTKGKPKFSYIRELINSNSSSTLNPFLHDELQIYGTLLGS
jgi:hypothetical protein